MPTHPSPSPHHTRATQALLEGLGLTGARGGRTLFEEFGFRLGPGELLQIEGPNGCGKTTLLRILCLLALPEAGEVRWNGMPAEEVRPDYLAQLAFLGHSPGIKADLTPRENLRVAAALGTSPTHGINGVEEALARLGLEAQGDTPVGELSAGQGRRAALARLSVQGARLWILDEPLTALDREAKQRVEALLEGHCGSGGMAILSTHQSMELRDTAVTRIQLGATVRAGEA